MTDSAGKMNNKPDSKKKTSCNFFGTIVIAGRNGRKGPTNIIPLENVHKTDTSN